MSGEKSDLDVGLNEDLVHSAEALVPGLIHEISQPLQSISAGLHLLADQLGPTVTGLEDWTMIERQVERLVEMLHGYQDFLYPENVALGAFPLVPVVKQAIDFLSLRLRKLQGRFSFDPAPTSSPYGFGHANAVLHATTNLISNAIDALGENTSSDTAAKGRLAVRIIHQPGSHSPLEIRVSDEGSGVAPANEERIFQSRFTTKQRGRGTGLGLSVARRMMRATGGDVVLVPLSDGQRLEWAKTEFAIKVPEPSSKREPLPSLKASAALAKRVLVVEDEDIILSLLDRALSLEGYQVVKAANTEQALTALSGDPFDLLLTDKNLPGAGGVEIVRQARQKNANMAIIMMTGYASAESAEALLPLEVDDYVTKPFDLTDLMTRISVILERRQQQQALPARMPPVANQRVLVVEPNDSDRQKLLEVLTAMGHQPITAGDLIEGLHQHAPLHALVVNRKLCTVEAKRELWQQRMTDPSFRVVMVSDGGGFQESIAALLVGAVAHLIRPLADDKLVEETLRRTLSSP